MQLIHQDYLANREYDAWKLLEVAKVGSIGLQAARCTYTDRCGSSTSQLRDNWSHLIASEAFCHMPRLHRLQLRKDEMDRLLRKEPRLWPTVAAFQHMPVAISTTLEHAHLAMGLLQEQIRGEHCMHHSAVCSLSKLHLEVDSGI